MNESVFCFGVLPAGTHNFTIFYVKAEAVMNVHWAQIATRGL